MKYSWTIELNWRRSVLNWPRRWPSPSRRWSTREREYPPRRPYPTTVDRPVCGRCSSEASKLKCPILRSCDRPTRIWRCASCSNTAYYRMSCRKIATVCTCVPASSENNCPNCTAIVSSSFVPSVCRSTYVSST